MRSTPRVSLSTTLLALSLCVGCGGGDESASQTGADARAERLAVLEAEAAANADTARERGERGDVVVEEKGDLAIERVELVPATASVTTEEFKATAFLAPGANAFTEITFRWTVDEREIRGYGRPRLGKAEGQWKAGDWIVVVAIATDDTGRTVESAPEARQIANGTPTITTDLRRIKFLNGTRLEADDPDGDEITWSVEGSPPGVSISKGGVIKVQSVQSSEAFAGEAVFVATDPHGARSEIHIPLSVNARTEAETVKTGEQIKYQDSRTMTDKEMIEKAEDDARRFEGMTEQEINKELDARDKGRR